jgi:uncharacterized protein (TIGR02099 family)
VFGQDRERQLEIVHGASPLKAEKSTPSMAQFAWNDHTMSSPEETHSVRTNPRDLPQSGRRVLKVMARAASVLLMSAGILFLAAWLALYGFLLPRVGAWKPEMEARASAALGVAVRIGQIEVPASGWVPALVLTEVTLLDEQGRTALRLPRVSAALSVQSLLSLELRFEQLLIEGAALDVRRDAAGRLRVGGLTLDGEAPEPVYGGQAAAQWLLAQGEFIIRAGQLRWVDEWRGAPPLVLQEVDFVLRNSLRQHDMRLDATLPEALGGRASLRGRFRHGLFVNRSDWRQWVGEVFAELPQADVNAWRPHVDLPGELVGGQGAARLWIDLDRGRVRGATADVALREVGLRWPGVAETMSFARFEGRLLARQEAHSLTLGLERVGFTTGQGQTWPASDMKLVLRHAPAPGESAAPPPGALPRDMVSAASSALSSAPANTVGSSAASAPTEAEPSEPLLPLLWDGLAGRVITGGDFSAAELDLGLMASVAGRAPLGATWHRHLLSLAPQGRIQDMKASWEGSPEQPTRYRITARLEGLRLEPGLEPASAKGAPVPGRPGVRGATIQLEATESAGRADLVIERGQLVFPGLFDQAEWNVDDLQARLSWQVKDGLELRLAPLTLRSADLDADLQGTWRGSWQDALKGHGQLDLSARIPRARAEQLHAYVPTTVPAATRSYLKRAVRGGRLQDFSIRVKGDLADFPFGQPKPKGEFRISGDWRDGTYLMVPEEPGYPAWPEATRLDARLRVTGQRVDFSEVRARLMGAEVLRTSGSVDWMNPAMPLMLDLQARGAAQDFLRYVQATPVNEWTSRVLASAQASGAAQLSLKLEVPLVGPDPPRVKGSVQLGGNELRLNPGLPALQNARGRVDFSEKGFSVAAATAQLLGGEVALEGGLSPTGSNRLQLQGVVQAAAVKASPELAWLAPLSAHWSGQAPYRVSLGMLGGQLQWVLTSPLTGLSIDLPAPFKKAASPSGPHPLLRVELTGLGGAAGAQRERVDVQWGRLLQARLVRQAQGGTWLAGAVGVGTAEPPPLPRSGTDVRVVAEHLDLDEWRALVWPPSPVGASPQGASLADGGALAAPLSVDLRAASAMFMGRRLDTVSAQAQALRDAAGGAAWRVDLQATQLAGRVEWRPADPGARERQARVLARLSRLSIPPAAQDAAEDAGLDERIEWPALDVVVEDFELRGRRLGRLEVAAEVERPDRAGPMRSGSGDWKLTRFALSNADAALNASGTWAGSGDIAGKVRRTAMDFELDLKDSGALLKRLGLEQALRAGAGRITGQVSWRGSPLSPDVRSMQGQLRLDLRSGQFLKADPGAARLLGVLSLQSLPRRLLLDFRDVFQEGFPFDAITGDVTVSGGVASTNNLSMRGIQAAVLMEGSADLNRETQDLRVLLVPEINAGTASLAYATINPALGLGTFLAQLFLRRPLMAANTREFSITGPWVDPKVERLQRSLPALPERNPP